MISDKDAIYRQDAIKYFAELWECIGTISDREEWEDVCTTTVNEIKSAEPERKKGYWIKKEPTIKELHGCYYECSKCHKFSLPFQKLNFCPNCGTNMKEGEQSEID